MSKKIRVCVLMGGPSAEKEVSLATGKAVFENLDRKKYAPIPVEMSADGRFFILQKNKKIRFNFLGLAKTKFDIVFIAMHGSPGEDGKIQGMLETLGVKYTGSGVLASAMAMNKVFAARIYAAFGLPCPDFIEFKQDAWKQNADKITNKAISKLGFPMVIKPVDQGSAVGVSVAKSYADLEKTIDKTIKIFPWLMAQKFIKGREATCGVLEKNGEALALPPTRILPNLGEFYDYNSKYSIGGSTHICPADFGDALNLQIQNLAVAAHKALGCRGMSRTDIFVDDNKKLHILETNTIPGMTPTSLFPEAAVNAGLSFSNMLNSIIASAD